MWDVVIVGAGPAGLSAALLLGRCRRSVLICDNGEPRNAPARALHGFLTRDGTPPQELLRLGRQELLQYESIELREVEVADAHATDTGFCVRLVDGSVESCRKLLLASGLVDDLPPVPGIEEYYGLTVHHCPYCDAWEFRDQPLAVYDQGIEFAIELTLWSRDIALCTSSQGELSSEDRSELERHGIRLCEKPIARLEGKNGVLGAIVFDDNEVLPRAALFFNTKPRQHCALVERLGCTMSQKGDAQTGPRQTTNVPGLYVAGDAARSTRLLIVAAADGVDAAFDINTSLHREDCARAKT